MDPATATLVATGITGASNLVSGLISGGMSYKKSRKLAKYAYSKDLEMWNRQNEYNLPINQMQRLEEAGLNPNMMYGQGVAGATGQAREMPRYQSVNAKYDFAPINALGALGLYQDLKIKQAQEENVRANTEAQEISNSLARGVNPEKIRQAVLKTFSDQDKHWQNFYTTEVMKVLYRSGVLEEQPRTQLEISQASAQKGRADAIIRNIESEMYEGLRKLDIGSKYLAPIMSLFKMILLKK